MFDNIEVAIFIGYIDNSKSEVDFVANVNNIEYEVTYDMNNLNE